MDTTYSGRKGERFRRMQMFNSMQCISNWHEQTVAGEKPFLHLA